MSCYVIFLDFKISKNQNRDCSVNNDIRVGVPNTPLVECYQICLGIPSCGGVVVYEGKCYYKPKSCRQHVFPNGGTTAYLLQGNQGK